MSEPIKKSAQRNTIIILLLMITLGAMGVSVWAIYFRKTTSTLAPDYAPHKLEESAKPIENDDKTKLNKPQGGGAVSLTYSKNVTITLSDKRIALLFANPSKSNEDMILQIVTKDTVIAQSGRIEPGNKVDTLKLVKGVSLSAGTYEGKFVVSYYQRENGEKAMLTTDIPLQIVAKN